MRKSELSRSFQLFLRIMRDGKRRDVVFFFSLCFFFRASVRFAFSTCFIGSMREFGSVMYRLFNQCVADVCVCVCP
jgi:hypothetical protein